MLEFISLTTKTNQQNLIQYLCTFSKPYYMMILISQFFVDLNHLQNIILWNKCM